ncbi:MAG: T9SS C-terminal target domain-containing protein [Sphingobacteriales bacterium]|nr:MAG: T9SS C-terminal target domain-containing protein [Sphingobacteriales bacterium]
MNKNLLLVFSSFILFIFLSTVTEYAFTSSAGAPAAHTGSPGDGGVTCNVNGCHTGMAPTAAAGWITSNVPGTGYIPGNTYTITTTATQAACVKFGFQISPQSASVTGTYLGTMIVTDATNTHIVSTKYMEQTSAGTIGTTGSHTWSFNWTAPPIGTGDVTFYGAYNCSNSNGGSSGDHIYTSSLVIPQCTASTTVTAGGPTTFCAGGSVTLNAGSGFSSYNWSNGATTQTINVTTPGSFSVTVTNSGGCPAIATSPVIVVNPTPTIPVITPVGSTTFCQGGSLTLNATSGLASYHWTNNSTTQSISVATAGNYIVTVTNANGCSSNSIVTTVTVNSLPTPAVTGSSTICSGSSSTLNAGSGYSAYHWSTGATTQTLTVSTANTFSVTVTNSNGCTGSTSITTTIGSALTPTISSSGSNTICQGSSVSLDAGSGFNTYNWSNGNTTQTISVNAVGNYSVNVSNTNGCTGSSNTVIISVVDTPISNASIFPNPVCNGDSVFANASGDTAWIYEWIPGGIIGKSVTLTPSSSTTYTLIATNSNNCSTSFGVPVQVFPLPAIPTIVQTGGILTANSSVANAYQWNLNGTIINGATNVTYNAAQQTGNYTVIITDLLGCRSESIPFNYLGDGISLLNNASFEIYPNPFTDFIAVENLNGENEIELLNVEGEIVFKNIVSSKNENINTSSLPAGFYLLKVKSEKEIINRVVVKN